MNKKQILCALCLGGSLLASAPAMAEFDAHDWQVRFRAISLTPDESSTTSNGGDIKADGAIMPELDITYFFTDNLAAELILATTKHDMSEVAPNIDLGSVWVLPPTLNLQYHFNNKQPSSPMSAPASTIPFSTAKTQVLPPISTTKTALDTPCKPAWITSSTNTGCLTWTSRRST